MRSVTRERAWRAVWGAAAKALLGVSVGLWFASGCDAGGGASAIAASATAERGEQGDGTASEVGTAAADSNGSAATGAPVAASAALDEADSPMPTGEPAASGAVTASASQNVVGDKPTAIKTEPQGAHVALKTPVVVTFDRDVAPEGVAVSVEPPIKGKIVWRDTKTLVFEPEGWSPGKAQHIRVEGGGIQPVVFQFLSLAPKPKRIEPGLGQKLTFTFDDGSQNPAQVAALLDLLMKEEVDAIFFPTGYWAQTHPKLIERMRKEGHRVCNHTYSHQNLRLPNLTEEAIRNEIAKGAGVGTCNLFRPPMRATDERLERIVAQMGYILYLWDVDSRDWEGLPADDMVNRVLTRVRPGSVVLFHMHGAEMLRAVTELIPKLKKAGYVFREAPDGGAPDAADAAAEPLADAADR